MTVEKTFAVEPVVIPENSVGAARILAQISKPGNVTADMKKLRDLHLILEGDSPLQNRSRETALNGALTVWHRVRRAVEIGDWFDRMFLAHNLPSNQPDVVDYARSLSESLGDRDKEQAWDPWKPVVHMAAGFRFSMLRSGRANYFTGSNLPRSVCVDQLAELIFDDHEWISVAVAAAESRMVLIRFSAAQHTKKPRFFMLDPTFSKNTPPT